MLSSAMKAGHVASAGDFNLNDIKSYIIAITGSFNYHDIILCNILCPAVIDRTDIDEQTCFPIKGFCQLRMTKSLYRKLTDSPLSQVIAHFGPKQVAQALAPALSLTGFFMKNPPFAKMFLYATVALWIIYLFLSTIIAMEKTGEVIDQIICFARGAQHD